MFNDQCLQVRHLQQSGKNKRNEGKEGDPPSKKRKFGHNVISRFSYKSRKEEDKKTSKSEAEGLKVTVATNVKRNIVS